MNNTAILTTTISPKLVDWLNQESKKENVSKRALIETALEKYRIEKEKREMAASFKIAAKDPEIIGLAEEGISDFLKQLNKYEL